MTEEDELLQFLRDENEELTYSDLPDVGGVEMEI